MVVNKKTIFLQPNIHFLYHVLTCSFIHPKLGKFRDFPRYTENSVFMTGFHDSIHIFHIVEIIGPYTYKL